MAQSMGIGSLGGAQLTFKRKFRWTFSISGICGGAQSIPERFVKLAARPNLSIDETEINFLNAKTWIPGKATWETITITYYDVATRDNLPLWNWLASVYNFTDPINLQMGSNRNDYAAYGNLVLYDGCGNPIEQWVLNDLWPQAVNFGDLDYATSDECNIELTLRYSSVKYNPICPGGDITPCTCGPCTGQTGNTTFSQPGIVG